MIRRLADDNFLLITQTAHARLAADLALELGNAQFGSPLPRQPVLEAIAAHDAGWPDHDDSPTVNPAGQPAHALEMPLETMVPIWSASTDLAAARHPYAGLLVSLHGLRLSFRAHPAPGAQQQIFALNKFQHRQIEIQETLRQQLGLRIDRPLRGGLAEPGASPEEDLLLFNFQILELADQLSLNLCFGEAKLPSIANVFTRPGKENVTIHFHCKPSGDFLVDPWPFECDQLDLSLPCVQIPARDYSGHFDLRGEIAAAPRTTQVRVRRHGS